MTEEEKVAAEETNSNQLYYILGAVLLVVVVAGGYMLRPKTTSPLTPLGAPSLSTPIRPSGPITELVCENQYYNPVVGFEKYFLSAEGGDVSEATEVTCTFTASVDGEIVATTSAKSPLTSAPERNGSVFKCTTEELALAAEVPTVVDITVKDDLGTTAVCTNTFLLPKP